jgi:hypothetical protein
MLKMWPMNLEKDCSPACGQLVEDCFQLSGFKDVRFCDKAVGMAESALFLSQAGKNLTSKGKNTSKKVHIPLSF